MSNFVCDENGNWVNLNQVVRMSEQVGDKYDLYNVAGSSMGRVDKAAMSLAVRPIVPAAAEDYVVELFLAQQDVRPAFDDVVSVRHKVVGWMLFDYGAQPLGAAADLMNDRKRCYVVNPDGTVAPVYEYDCFFVNMKSAIEGFLNLAQMQWDREHLHEDVHAD